MTFVLDYTFTNTLNRRKYTAQNIIAQGDTQEEVKCSDEYRKQAMDALGVDDSTRNNLKVTFINVKKEML